MRRKKVLALFGEVQREIANLRAWDAVLEKRMAHREQITTNMRKRAEALDNMLANADLLKVDQLLKKINWMHERLDLLANRVDQIRGRSPAAVGGNVPEWRPPAAAKRKPRRKGARR
jgi:galactokinase/mevalonate kinase-like predicted kinase